MPGVGFEPTISASKRAKTVHVLDRSATVTGNKLIFFIGTTAPVGLGLPPWNSPFHFGFFPES
jgi:hypothetical protein